MTPRLYLSIARAERAIDRVGRYAGTLSETSARRVHLLAHVERERGRLEELLEQLPACERNRHLRIRALAGAAYMTKSVGAIVEIYDRTYRRLGDIPAGDAGVFHRALAEAGRVQEGRHPGYTGGATREPGLALWWKDEQD